MMLIQRTRRSRRSPARQPQTVSKMLGFTLVELLVVVAIIAMLIAILVPSLRQARVQAKRIACAANLREIAGAWHMYLDEYEGRFLEGDNIETWNVNVNFGGQQGRAGWQYEGAKPLNTYLGLPLVVGQFTDAPADERTRLEHSAEIFCCGADTGGEHVSPSIFDYYGSSYQTNMFLIGTRPLTYIPGDPVLTRELVRKLNRRLLTWNLTDVNTDHSMLLLVADYGWECSCRYNSTQRFEWHDAPLSHNLAFLDGHVKFTRIRKGLHVTADYITIPFRDLADEVEKLQQPGD